MSKQNKRPPFISSLTEGDFSAGGVKLNNDGSIEILPDKTKSTAR